MPELPEVETVRQDLLSRIIGESIASVEIYRPQSIAHPSPKQFAALLPGHRFVDIDRRGKYLLLHLEGVHGKALLVLHLRMSGRLLFLEKGTKKANQFLRIRLLLQSKKQLLFEDMRVFGRLWFVPPDSNLTAIIPALANLGPEPLSGLTASQLRQVFKGRRQVIKAALLDQTLLAGIGNIYADEILFKAQINPLTPAGQLTAKQYRTLSHVMPRLLKQAIDLGGSSLKDFKNSQGVNGNYQNISLVYGRTGKNCRVCQTLIIRLKIAGRSSHFCPQCQPLPSPIFNKQANAGRDGNNNHKSKSMQNSGKR